MRSCRAFSAEAGEVFCRDAHAYAGVVFMERHVEHPVQIIFHAPVMPCESAKSVRVCAVETPDPEASLDAFVAVFMHARFHHRDA